MFTETPHHLLYVDDEEILLDITSRYLSQSDNFTVDTASSAKEALELLQNKYYDAIVSDYQMPEMDGIAFLEHLRGNGNTIPFILFTGKGRDEVAIQALNAGADFYIQKGGRPKTQFAELANSVRYAVAKKQANKALEILQSKYFHIFNAMSDAIVYTDANQRILWMNQEYLDLLGTDHATVRGKPCHEVFWKEEQRCPWCKVPEILTTGTSVSFPLTFLNRNYQITAEPVKNETGEITNFLIRGTDITEHRDDEPDAPVSGNRP